MTGVNVPAGNMARLYCTTVPNFTVTE